MTTEPETEHQDQPEQPATSTDTEATEAEPDTFPRTYVEQLREESARYRQRAGRADEAEQRLLTAALAEHAGNLLADPTDLLTFGRAEDLVDADGWPDPERITAAATALTEERPHLTSRRPRGDIGQGETSASTTTDLAAILRGGA